MMMEYYDCSNDGLIFYTVILFLYGFYLIKTFGLFSFVDTLIYFYLDSYNLRRDVYLILTSDIIGRRCLIWIYSLIFTEIVY